MFRIPQVPLLPDPLRRIHLPSDPQAVTVTAPEADPEPLGVSREAVERVWDAGVHLYESGVHPALQLCVRRHGEVILDRSIGHARGNGPDDDPETDKVLVTPDTPFCVFSTSKALVAVVVFRLIERGALRLQDRVADYIPEYAAHGKDQTTIAHVLSHRAGIPTLASEAFDLDRLDDREFIWRTIADTKPTFTPGTLLAYHAVSGGFILDEIVYRVTGKNVRDVFEDEIREPLGFRWTSWGVASEDVDKVGLNYATGPRVLPPATLLVKRVLGAGVERVVEMSNDRRFLTGLLPSANVMTTGNELCRFFELLRAGGELDGVRVLTPQSIRTMLTEQARLEIDFSLWFPTRFAYGMMLGSRWISLLGRDTDLAFGHLGLINIMGWADPERGVSAGLITTGKPLVYPEVARFYGVMQQVASEMPKVPQSERAI